MSRVVATAIVTVIVLLVFAPLIALLAMKLFYRRETTLFLFGETGFPILGPGLGAAALRVSAIGYLVTSRKPDRESERDMVMFLMSLLGLVVFSAFAVSRALS